jgi:[ribosomal protein S18]-alanine N-acetyltransferase
MIALPAPYHLRPMTVTDIPAVLAVDRLSFPTPASEQLYVHELTENPLAHYQVLTEGNGVAQDLIGYAGFWLIAGEVHISTIAVRPDRRGRRLGEWLLLNLLLLACEITPLLITLEVRRSNRVARNLYDKYRFEEVGVRLGYYRDTGEDALLLTVDLQEQAGYCAWLRRQVEETARVSSSAD